MKCPACIRGRLHPSHIEASLPACECHRCHGFLLALAPYSRWLQTQDSSCGSDGDTTSADPAVNDSESALLCPKCQRLMTRLRVSADATHRLDYCFACDEIWLDPGEWTWLKARGLHLQLRTISTKPWQRRLRQQLAAQHRKSALQAHIPPGLLDELQALQQWLQEQPECDAMLEFLQCTSPWERLSAAQRQQVLAWKQWLGQQDAADTARIRQALDDAQLPRDLTPEALEHLLEFKATIAGYPRPREAIRWLLSQTDSS